MRKCRVCSVGVTGEGLFAIIWVVKRLFILAGANGSGKSTISKVLLPTEHIVYVNPDDIAKELNPSDPSAARIEAGKETLRRIDLLLEKGDSFAIESTLSGNMYVKVLERAKSLGYVIIRERYTAFMEGLCQN